MTAIPDKALKKKTARQPRAVTRSPPTIGPPMEPSPTVADMRPMPWPRSLPENMAAMIAIVLAVIIPVPTPCTALNRIIGTRLGDRELKLPDEHPPHVAGEHRHLRENHVFEDLMQLVNWIREGTPSLVSTEHARHVIDIIESGYRAAATGQTQELKTTFTPLPLDALAHC